MVVLRELTDDLAPRGASDLHLAAGYPPLGRIRGRLVPLRDGELDAKAVQETLFAIMPPGVRSRLEREQRVAFAHEQGGVRFRVECFRDASGALRGVMRVVPERVATLAEQGAPDAVVRLAERRSGLVIVTGPRRSGKSTLLAAMVAHVNATRACHILTIEEPIEHVHEPFKAQITQREIGTHAKTLELAMQSARRENPDVVLTGDATTRAHAQRSLDLAAAGALVFVSSSGSSVRGALHSFLSAFPADEQADTRKLLGETLAGVVAQHLVWHTNREDVLAIHEILVGTPEVASLVRDGKLAELAEVMQSSPKLGMQTLDSALERLVRQSRISAEDALDRATDRERFAQTIARVRPDLADLLG